MQNKLNILLDNNQISTKAESLSKLKPLGKRTKKLNILLYIAINSRPGKSARELSFLTAIPINVVTPRINEMIKSGLITSPGIKYDLETERWVKYYQVTEIGDKLINVSFGTGKIR